MKKYFISLLIITFSMTILFSQVDFNKIDKMIDDGEFNNAYKELDSSFDKANPDPRILWRLGRAIYEIADAKNNKKDTIATCEKGMESLKDYLDMKNGDAIDRAKVIYWYDVLYSRRGKAIGIKESLNIISELFNLADKALSVYPELGEPYHLKAMIDEAVPGFLGGDKFRMGENFTKAIKYGSDTIVFLVDAADGFNNRNWDVKKKEKMGKSDGTPSDLSDREYAKELLQKSIDIASKKTLTKSEKSKIDQANNLLKKIK